MLALTALGLAAGAWIFQAPVPKDPPATAGRIVLAASTWDPNSSSKEVVAPLVLELGTANAGRDAARAPKSAAEDTDLAAAVSAATAVELRGGTWLGWYQATHAQRHELAWTRALRRVHAEGRTVRASGAAAAWIARWSTVPRSVLDKPSQDPHDRSLDVPVEGLGLLDGPLVGVVEAGAPSADRIVERAVTHGYRSVLILAGDVELDCDPRAMTARVRRRGDGCAVWIDLGAATRSRERIRAARVALPDDGDVLDLRRGALEQARTDAAAVDVGGAEAWQRAERRLVRAATAEVAAGELRGVRASADERTLRTPAGGWQGLRLDFEIARDAP